MTLSIRLTALSMFVVAAFFDALPVQAEAYRLAPGDRVLLTYSSQGTSSEMSVNIDGQLRIPGVGGVRVAGVTLDEAEARLVEKIAQGGIFLDPKVSLQVVSYAPVVVSGDVFSPGQYSYFPGMTVASALALSGGSQQAGISRYEIERAQADNMGAIRALNLEIAGFVLQIARLQSLLEDSRKMHLPDDLAVRIPAPDAIPLARLQQAEQGLLLTIGDLLREGLAAYDEEISLIEQQLALFPDRIALQEEVVVATERELLKSRELQDRGLQTATRLSNTEQKNADARARALELEAARIGAVQALAEARRARALFERRRREDWLQALQTARLALNDREISYARRLEQQAILSGSILGVVSGAEILEPEFTIVSVREGRESLTSITPQTLLLPGELLLVTVNRAEDS